MAPASDFLVTAPRTPTRSAAPRTPPRKLPRGRKKNSLQGAPATPAVVAEVPTGPLSEAEVALQTGIIDLLYDKGSQPVRLSDLSDDPDLRILIDEFLPSGVPLQEWIAKRIGSEVRISHDQTLHRVEEEVRTQEDMVEEVSTQEGMTPGPTRESDSNVKPTAAPHIKALLSDAGPPSPPPPPPPRPRRELKREAVNVRTAAPHENNIKTWCEDQKENTEDVNHCTQWWEKKDNADEEQQTSKWWKCVKGNTHDANQSASWWGDKKKVDQTLDNAKHWGHNKNWWDEKKPEDTHERQESTRNEEEDDDDDWGGEWGQDGAKKLGHNARAGEQSATGSETDEQAPKRQKTSPGASVGRWPDGKIRSSHKQDDYDGPDDCDRKGIVTSVFPDRKYGFIDADDTGKSVFFLMTSITSGKGAHEGLRVRFNMMTDQRTGKRRADKVSPEDDSSLPEPLGMEQELRMDSNNEAEASNANEADFTDKVAETYSAKNASPNMFSRPKLVSTLVKKPKPPPTPPSKELLMKHKNQSDASNIKANSDIIDKAGSSATKPAIASVLPRSRVVPSVVGTKRDLGMNCKRAAVASSVKTEADSIEKAAETCAPKRVAPKILPRPAVAPGKILPSLAVPSGLVGTKRALNNFAMRASNVKAAPDVTHKASSGLTATAAEPAETLNQEDQEFLKLCREAAKEVAEADGAGSIPKRRALPAKVFRPGRATR